MAEGVGNAPTSGLTDLDFKTSAASLYLPAFLKCRIQNSERKMALAEGVSPSSSALEPPCSVIELRERKEVEGRQSRAERQTVLALDLRPSTFGLTKLLRLDSHQHRPA
jgi:hypothetical protein